MIRVERDEKAIDGKWRWRSSWQGDTVEGLSSEPLLSACRALKAMGAESRAEAALFRPGRETWDLRTTVGYGSTVRIRENPSPRTDTYRGHARLRELNQ